ncbi:MAG TPA: S8 family serine peptidase, partial [Halococcus sp.]|nr:S8 family serine peptidase [Halococcus sp.]
MFLAGIAAASTGVVATAPASAAQRTTYLVSGNKNAPHKLERAGFTVQHELSAANVIIVAGPDDAERDIQRVNGVQHVARDVAYEVGEAPVAPADATPEPRYADRQWDKQVTEAFEAHETATGEGTRLAIMDTGVDATHPDLKDNVNTNLGRSFINGEIGTDTSPVHPHGTHTAGIAGATGDVGVVGMAPDTEIVPLRVFAKEGPLIEKVSDCLLAFDYAAEIGADAVNVSLGWDPRPPQENQIARGVRRVICERVVRSVVRRGTTAVVAAGNADWDLQHGGY